jgi:hypothetical protein
MGGNSPHPNPYVPPHINNRYIALIVKNVYITTNFKPILQGGGGVNWLVEAVYSKGENS